MRRRLIFRIAVFLVLGAFVNFAVAWGIALYRVESRGAHFPIPAAQWRQFIHAPQDWPEPTWQLNRRAGLGWTVAEAGTLPPGAVTATHYCWEGRFGFPLLSMQGNLNWNIAKSFRRTPDVPTQYWLADLGTKPTILPLHPLPLGFLCDTVFYAALLYSIPRGVAFIRGALRLRRNLCPKCAYPIGPSPICSECGTPLPAARAPNP